MGVDKYRPHVLVLPEDSNFADIANGFKSRLGHPRQFRVEGFGGGKDGLLERVRNLLPSLAEYNDRYLVLLFDGDAQGMFASSYSEFPENRVFCFCTRKESEDLRTEFRTKNWLDPNRREEIGRLLADDCLSNSWVHWSCDQLAHCVDVRTTARQQLESILFNKMVPG